MVSVKHRNFKLNWFFKRSFQTTVGACMGPLVYILFQTFQKICFVSHRTGTTLLSLVLPMICQYYFFIVNHWPKYPFAQRTVNRLFQRDIFLPVIGPKQIHFLSIVSIICLSYIFKINNKPKYPASPRTDNQGFLPVVYKICLSGPVGPTISERSGLTTIAIILCLSFL